MTTQQIRNDRKGPRTSARRLVVSALTAALVLAACGGESSEKLLSSARDYMAKNDNKAAVIQLKNALQNDPKLAEARFLLGKAMLDGGDPTSAEVELRKAMDLAYPDDKLVPLLARTYLMLGQPKKLIDELAAKPMTEATSKADLATSLGQAQLMLGKLDAGRAAIENALAAQPDFAPALVAKARLLAADRDLTGALAVLEPALQQSPGVADAWYLKGGILTAQGDATAAAEAFRKALEIKPDFLPAHTALVARSLDERKLDEAAKQLEVMRKIAPNHPQTFYLQAELFYQQKNFAAARETLQQYLKAIPDSGPALQLAGLVEYELKSYTLAEDYLQRALPKMPGAGVARRALVATYLRNRQPEKALATLEPILDQIDKDSNMQALAGEVFMQNGEVEKAAEYFANAAQLDPESSKKRTSVALSRLALGETAEANRELQEIAATDTGINADLALIASQLKGRQFDAALASIDALAKKQPDNPLALNLRAVTLLGKRDVAAARQSFEDALKLDPAYFPAAAGLANLDLAEKKSEDAQKRFEAVLAKDPKNVQAQLALAGLRLRLGAPTDEVAKLINAALNEKPDDTAPRLALIGLYLNARDANKALTAAQDALGVMPNRPEILDAAGRAQQFAGDFNQALASYGKLASLLPKSPLPYLRMAEIQVAAKNKDSAMQSLRKALAIKEDLIEAQRGLMMLDVDAGRTDDAIAIARQVQTQRPKEAIGYILEGDVYALKKNWAEAAGVYRKGIKQSGSTELAVKLHAVLDASKGAAEADKFVADWLKDHPKDMQFQLYLAEAANAQKNYARASKYYRALVDAQPENPAMLNNLAWTLSQNKDPKAIDYAEKAYRLAPDQPALMDTLGVLLVDRGNSGDSERGLGLLRKAVEATPQAAVIRLNLARALVKVGNKEEAKKELEVLAKLGDQFPMQADVKALMQGL